MVTLPQNGPIRHCICSIIILTSYTRGFVRVEQQRIADCMLCHTHVLPNLDSYEKRPYVTGGKPIAVLLQSISGVSA
jgi:hypothetical protein